MSIMSPVTDRAGSGGGAYSGRMTEQSLMVHYSLLLSGCAVISALLACKIREATYLYFN